MENKELGVKFNLESTTNIRKSNINTLILLINELYKNEKEKMCFDKFEVKCINKIIDDAIQILEILKIIEIDCEKC